jgi:uncharacterized protein
VNDSNDQGLPRRLLASSRVASPWKNGGGVTREVAAQPSTASPGFDWRISIADIERPGLFSSYPGVDRMLAVLEGQLELTIEDKPPLSLSSRSPAVNFPGEARVSAVPVSIRSRDLNIMVQRDGWRSTLEALQIGSEVAITADDRVTVALSLGDLRCVCRGSPFNLGYLDALIFQGASTLRIDSGSNDATLLLIRISTPARDPR